MVSSSHMFLVATPDELFEEEAHMASVNRNLPKHHKRKRMPVRSILAAGQLSRLEDFEASWKEARMQKALAGEIVPEVHYFANLSQNVSHFNR